jgi:hypothetical protein
MPLDDTGAEQPLEPALKRALLESGAAFEELVKIGKRHTGIEWHRTDPVAEPPARAIFIAKYGHHRTAP